MTLDVYRGRKTTIQQQWSEFLIYNNNGLSFWCSHFGQSKPGEPATFVQRTPNVFQTPWTFGTRWVVLVQTSLVHYWEHSFYVLRSKLSSSEFSDCSLVAILFESRLGCWAFFSFVFRVNMIFKKNKQKNSKHQALTKPIQTREFLWHEIRQCESFCPHCKSAYWRAKLVILTCVAILLV